MLFYVLGHLVALSVVLKLKLGINLENIHTNYTTISYRVVFQLTKKGDGISKKIGGYSVNFK